MAVGRGHLGKDDVPKCHKYAIDIAQPCIDPIAKPSFAFFYCSIFLCRCCAICWMDVFFSSKLRESDLSTYPGK